MKIAIIALTKNGRNIAETIDRAMGDNHLCHCMILEKYAQRGDVTFSDLKKLIAEIFGRYDALIFVCACGIAVRMIAPHVTSKTADPAVLAVDERGKFAVSLLSGHIGGANALTERVSEIIGAVSVITTATDAGGRFSPDCFAAANGLHICEMSAAKEIAAAVVHGQKIGFQCAYPYENFPDQYFCGDGASMGICVSEDSAASPFDVTLHLVPRNIIIGAGCKRGTPSERFSEFVLAMLQKHDIPIWRVCELHTIDLKQDEAAMVEFCREHRVIFKVYSSERLMAVQGEFAHSDFVMNTTGADNICERSAAIDGAELIVRKQIGGGMTFAAAKRQVHLDFDRRIL